MSGVVRKVAVEGVENRLGEVDMSYRYKMEVVDTQVTSHHLVVRNMSNIAAALEVDPKWIAKYLSVECGARCSYKKDGAAYLSVGHASSRDSGNRSAQVQRLVRQFIDLFVICPRKGCLNPEWSLFVAPDGLASKCPACGAALPCPGRDHKVGTMIRKALIAARKKGKAGKKRGKGGKAKGRRDDGTAKEPWRREAVAPPSDEHKEASPDGKRPHKSSSKHGKSSSKHGKSSSKHGKSSSKHSKSSSKHGKSSSKHGKSSSSASKRGKLSGDAPLAAPADDPEFASLVASLATATTQLGGDDDWWSSDDDDNN